MADRGSARSNVYTVLALIALLALATAAGFLWVKSGELFGNDASPLEIRTNVSMLVEPVSVA